MALVRRKTDEEKAQAAAERARVETERAERKRTAEIEAARQAFYRTPAGQARVAFDRGDQVFQYSQNVMSQQAIIVAMVGSRTAAQTADPSVILNSVCNEGWELITGSFVFVEQGQQSRDKFMSSGQNVAVKGMTVGYYLFRRHGQNKRDLGEPWLQGEIEQLACPACEAIVTPGQSECPYCGQLLEWPDEST